MPTKRQLEGELAHARLDAERNRMLAKQAPAVQRHATEDDAEGSLSPGPNVTPATSPGARPFSKGNASAERLVLDYRRGGSPELQLGAPLNETTSVQTMDRARSFLTARSETPALAMLNEFDFALHVAANGLGDEFLAVHALATPVSYARLRESLDAIDQVAKNAATALRKAIADACKDEREVRFLAISLAENIVHGELGDYVFDENHFDSGGFATIHRAHDKSGQVVALKRLSQRDEEAIARMRREIQEQRRLTHENVMTIIDHDSSYRWFVMPLADGNLVDKLHDDGIDDALLCEVVRAAASGLGAAHAVGLVHRDVTPRNVLQLNNRWVVSDWGVVRRPRGMTTLVRTQGELGSNGFAAPELFRDAHNATPAADVYALGRIVAWAVTRKWPEQNLPLLPEGIWRQFVRRTTEHEATRRPQTMAKVLELLAGVEADLFHESHQPAVEEVSELLSRIARGEEKDRDALLAIALERSGDADLYIDEIATMSEDDIAILVNTRPEDVAKLAQAMHRACQDVHWGGRSYDYMNVPLRWLYDVARAAERKGDLGLLEDAVSGLFEFEPMWDRWAQQARTRDWLESLKEGPGAATIARALRRFPSAAALYLKEWTPRRVPQTIRAALVAGQRANEGPTE